MIAALLGMGTPAPAAETEAATAVVAPGAEAATPSAEHFACADAFDLVARMVMFRCDTYQAPAAANRKIAAAVARLRAFDLITPQTAADTRIEFCPLLQATGMVPVPGRIYLDDGLIDLSTDGLAEIVAHEFVHIDQFARFGIQAFKCAYVRAMAACGGCQDRQHALEAEAYARQDAVRERLYQAPAATLEPDR